MSDQNDEIAVILQRGDKLSQDDLREIDFLLTQGDPETAFERRGWIYERIAMIVADPLYKGDITLDDLETDDPE